MIQQKQSGIKASRDEIFETNGLCTAFVYMWTLVCNLVHVMLKPH